MECAFSKSFRGLAVVVALALSAPAGATYVFTNIDYPGAAFTDVRAIDNTGQIAGYGSIDGTSHFSFVYSGGVFATLPDPLVQPSVLGMNDLNMVVGGTTVGAEQGFIYQASTSTYTFFSRPGWTNTEARGIDPLGTTVTGWSYESGPSGETLSSSGFLYKPSTGAYADISFPGAIIVIAQGINSAGQVVGSALVSGSGQQAFLREPGGAVSLFRVASSPTAARGINDNGVITGFVTTGGTQHAFVGTSGGFELLDMPGAAATFGEAINNSGQVSGLWNDAIGNTHGFIATPAAMPTGTTSGGAYTFAVDVVPDVPIFIDPPVAVGYDYAIGKRDPRIAKVQLPIGIGDSLYVVKVDGRKWVVAGGQWFDFRAHGFPRGVSDFRVSCIEAASGLDPANPQAFPTGLTFVGAGRFTGTQKPRVRDSHAHDGASCLKDDD